MNNTDKTSKFTALIETAILEEEKEISVAQSANNDRNEFPGGCRKIFNFKFVIPEFSMESD
nr:hypothetical protein [uncultured Desulfuromonas sp.]